MIRPTYCCVGARRLMLLTTAVGLLASLGAPGRAQDAEKNIQLKFSDPSARGGLRETLTLRPNLLQQVNVYVEVAKDQKEGEKVAVEVRSGNTIVARSADVVVKPGEPVLVNFGKDAVPAPGKEPVLTPLSEDGKIDGKICLLSGTTILKEYDLKPVRPRAYVEVVPGSVQYFPRLKRLTAVVSAMPTFVGPKCKVELKLLPGRIPGLEKDSDLDRTTSSYAGYLTRPGDRVTLVADNLNIPAGAGGKDGLVYLNVDGYPRAFTYRMTFEQDKNASTAEEVLQPVLGLRAKQFAAPSGAYHVDVEIDNIDSLDPKAVALLTVERPKAGDAAEGDLRDSEVVEFRSDRREQMLFAAGGPGGCLYFKPEVRDWSADFDTREVYGTRYLKLRLQEDKPDGAPLRAIDSAEVGKTGKLPPEDQRSNSVSLGIKLDATPPLVKFTSWPPELLRDKDLPVKATASDPESAIREVWFFVGKPLPGDKIPDGALKVAGRLIDEKNNLWAADLGLDTSQKNSYDVSVQATNNAGLVATETVIIKLVDPKPATPPTPGPTPTPVKDDGTAKTATPAAKKLPTIEGTVLIGPRPQPNLEVSLRDEKNNVKATATTNATGQYVFKDVAPGVYKVTAAKPAERLKGETTTSVAADNKTGIDVKLTR